LCSGLHLFDVAVVSSIAHWLGCMLLGLYFVVKLFVLKKVLVEAGMNLFLLSHQCLISPPLCSRVLLFFFEEYSAQPGVWGTSAQQVNCCGQVLSRVLVLHF
jgi:hypothetical protein